jgi:hypothetical protein
LGFVFEILANAEQKFVKQGQFLSVKPGNDLAIETMPHLFYRRPDLSPHICQKNARDAFVAVVGTALHEPGFFHSLYFFGGRRWAAVESFGQF